ncbi:MAG: tRNA (adenosine(37)-N6)-threonylcarbamoyltransferase complex dimerization subunit type 1 TsaB [Omnitrophica bacterium RIFCSPLOWO2_12_FULL_50_11]|nr:MAG: tRNA (adenosine(37)-N6)-threonylcarbamoyltransferase complex dimerization subunit type 1 TsaB [Omnitrophica bacterium RIFCSPLOWO2_12_FULL_50_11]
MKDENNILAIDTSSKVLSVAIRSGSKAVSERNLEGTPRHSEQLIDEIEHGLKVLKLKKEDLTHLIWGLGPGSFTGLRIGFSILKGLHLGLNRRMALGASSLDVIAFGCGLASGTLAVCVDARRERIYTSLYRFQHGAMMREAGDALFSADELLDRVDGETVFVGDALLAYGDVIRKKVGMQAVFLNPIFWYPRAVSLIRLWEEKEEWLEPLSLRTMIPRYLRRSEAEEKISG